MGDSFVGGKQGEEPLAQACKVEELLLHLRQPIPVGGDGEPLGVLPGVTDAPAVVEVLTGALSVIA